MELVSFYKRATGLDVHQAQITACAIIEDADDTTRVERAQFGAFKRDRHALAEWARALSPELVVMGSTGIYWKSPYAALEAVGIRAHVVNARHVNNVPGGKTDVGDAQWLAKLARAGLLRASFVPPANLRERRLIARQRQKLVGHLASEKNRLHKVLTDGGVRLGVVVSDVHGQSARAMIKALIAGRPIHEVRDLASNRLKASREELFDALQGQLSASHCFVLSELMSHIEEIEARIARFDARLFDGLGGEQAALALLQTVPGVDLTGATMLLVEIGTDMRIFDSADRQTHPAAPDKAIPTCADYCAKSPVPQDTAHHLSHAQTLRLPARTRLSLDTNDIAHAQHGAWHCHAFVVVYFTLSERHSHRCGLF